MRIDQLRISPRAALHADHHTASLVTHGKLFWRYAVLHQPSSYLLAPPWMQQQHPPLQAPTSTQFTFDVLINLPLIDYYAVYGQHIDGADELCWDPKIALLDRKRFPNCFPLGV